MMQAKNGQTGEIEYINADAATVIQSVVDLLATGGCICIKRGTYNITTEIDINNSDIIIRGEGKQTVLEATAALTNLIDIGDDNVNVFLIDLTLSGNGNVDYTLNISRALATNRAKPVYVQNCDIHGADIANVIATNRDDYHIQASYLGIGANRSPYNLYDAYGSACFVDHTVFHQSTTAGIYLSDSKTLYLTNSMLGCYTGDQVQLEDGGRLKGTNVWFDTLACHSVFNSGGASWGELMLTNCHVAGQIEGRFSYIILNGVWLDYAAPFATHILVTVTMALFGSVYLVQAAAPRFTITGRFDFYDTHFIRWESNLKRWGTATILNGNNSVVVNHGFYSTPTSVQAQGDHEQTRDLIVHTVGGVQFTIGTGDGVNVGADRLVRWQGWYEP